MQASTTKAGPCTYEMEIQVAAEEVDKGFHRAYRDFAEITKVPGFRPGKAPRRILERYVDQERLERHVMEIIAGPAFREAAAQEGLIPETEPDVEPGDIQEGDPWTFRARFYTAPVVELGDVESISVRRPIFEVTDAIIDQAIENLRSQHLDHRPVTDRGIQAGDVAVIDLILTLEGDTAGSPERILYRYGDGIPGFDDAITGQIPDETREFDLTYPDDYRDPERAGKPARCSAHVVSIHTEVAPDVTDAWIQSTGNGDSVEAFRNRERERITERQREISDEIAANAAIEALASSSTVEYPPPLLESEISTLVSRLRSELAQTSTSYEQYLAAGNMTAEQHESRLEAEADARVRTRLVLREYARSAGITITDDDAESAQDATRLLIENEQIPSEAMARSYTYSVLNRILHQRITQHLLPRVQITEYVWKDDAHVEGGAANDA